MARTVTAWFEPLCGVVEQGMVTLRSFRNLGGLQSSLVQSAVRAPLYEKALAGGAVSGSAGDRLRR